MDLSKVVLVNENDEEIGIMDKLEAHKKGFLHRAISVFIFNSNGEWLLQQRAIDKYHSGGLWTNSCCTHPAAGEQTLIAAKRRLKQEMGIDCTLKALFHFIYKDKMDNNLTEHELDHVFVGFSDELPRVDLSEVMNFMYVDYQVLEQSILKNPDLYTAWFKRIYSRVHETLNQKYIYQTTF